MHYVGAAVRGLLIMLGTAVVFITILAVLLALVGHGIDVREHSVVQDFWVGRGISGDGGDSPMAIRLALAMAFCAGLVAATAVHGRRR